MVRGARERGWHYLGVSDHSVSAVYASGLDVERIREQHREIRELAREFPDFTIFKGIESDILADGTLDYDDDVLSEFDFVIASVHSRFRMPREEMTERILTAVRHPAVAVLGHPSGRLLLTREAYPVDLERVVTEAGRLGVAVELNANPQRLDLDWRHLRSAVDQGVLIAICPDAHDVAGYDDTFLGVAAARKGWLTKKDVLNCRSAEEVAEFFRARRRDWQALPGHRSRFGPRGEKLP
jgi:DNA polymerase (family 10)